MKIKIEKNKDITKPSLLTRGNFIARTGRAVLAAAALTAGFSKEEKPHWKGQKDSRIKQWDVITMGNLGRNRYWGESDDKGVRSTICTCTLITCNGFRILVDPSLADPTQMAKELDRRTGLKLSDVTSVFVTHEHPDHYPGIANFPDAKWQAAPDVAEILNKSGKLPRIVEVSRDQLFDGIKLIPTPGHTNAHHSLVFDCGGQRIVIAGDAVMTKDFFRERRGYRNSFDFELATKTINMLAEMADIIVPGHDNYFLVDGAE